MIAYLTSIYFNLYGYGLWIFLALGALSVGGGVILALAMADNGEKGTLDFSLEHLSKKSEQYGSLIGYWKKATGAFVIVSLLAVFAPNEALVKSWMAPPSPCAPTVVQ